MAVIITFPNVAEIGLEDTIGLILTFPPGESVDSVEWVQTNPIGVIIPGATLNTARFKPTQAGTTGIFAKCTTAPA